MTTYRRDGSPVSTPVWFAEDAGRLIIATAADSYTAKRLRRNPAALGRRNARGVAKAEPVAVAAELLPRRSTPGSTG